MLSFTYPCDRDLYLEGRGLVLIPCYFGLYHPVALADPRLRPVLAFPIRAESRLLAGGTRTATSVSALLGSTRALILRSVIGGSTTTGLAKAVGVAPATVSHHTRALREAGLITTERHENFARHLITPLGLQLLGGGGDHGGGPPRLVSIADGAGAASWSAGQKHDAPVTHLWERIFTFGQSCSCSPWVKR